jgi:hypothetical protein
VAEATPPAKKKPALTEYQMLHEIYVDPTIVESPTRESEKIPVWITCGVEKAHSQEAALNQLVAKLVERNAEEDVSGNWRAIPTGKSWPIRAMTVEVQIQTRVKVG